uniref:Uncharacterized protein n=1 Tax=Lepeophtheirus salmonis TaxID=72036 RepID=A0A0K2TC35_LEPSM
MSGLSHISGCSAEKDPSNLSLLS